MRLTGVLLWLVLGAAGCEKESACEKLAHSVCTRACACTAECFVIDTRGFLTVSRRFDDQEDCEKTSANYCEDDGLDPGACTADLETATCEEPDPVTSSEGGLVLPLTCMEASGACGAEATCEECLTCANAGPCSELVTACEGDCLAFVQCVGELDDPATVAVCTTDHPTGATEHCAPMRCAVYDECDELCEDSVVCPR